MTDANFSGQSESSWSRAEESLRRALSAVGTADSKATGVFALAAAMLGSLAAAAPKHFACTTQWDVIIAAALLLGLSVIFLSLCTIPRLKGPDSLLYFGGVAAHPLEKFRSKVLARTDEEYLDDLVCQIHRNSEIATEKFAHIRRAMLLIYTATPFWVASIFLSYWKG